MKAWQAVALSVILTLFFGTLITRWLMGYTTLDTNASAPSTSEGAPDFSVYAGLLAAHATPTGFDFKAARQDLQLEQSYALFAALDNRIQGSEDERYAQEINAYNLIVLVGITRNWPIETIEDMASAIEPIPGFGYFQARRYHVFGEKLSIHALDQRIRANALFDVRVPFSQSCGLVGCARVDRRPLTGQNLDEELNAGVRRFLENPAFVRVNDEPKQVEIGAALFAIQEPLVALTRSRGWADDFESALRFYGQGAPDLLRALDQGYEIIPLPFSFAIAAAR